jgi:protein TonB
MAFAQHQDLSGIHGLHLPGWIALSLLAHLLVLSVSGGIVPASAPFRRPLMTVDIVHVSPETSIPVTGPGPESNVEMRPSAPTPPQADPPQSTTSRQTPPEAEVGLPFPFDAYFSAREVDVGAEPSNEVLLRYPWIEYRQRLGGVVRVTLFINEQGGLDKINMVDAVPPGHFEEAALEAVNSLQFTPALKKGRPVKSRKTIEVIFDPSERFNQPAPR